MMIYELYKALFNKKTLLFLLILLSLKVFFSLRMELINGDEINIRVYRDYMNQLEGTFSKEKQSWVEQESKRLTELKEKEIFYDDQYKNNEISASEYKQYNDDVQSAKSRILTFGYVIEKTNYYSKADQKLQYFYDIEVEQYLSNMNADIFLILALFMVITPLFTEDYYTNMLKMVKSSKYGRMQLFRIKLLCTFFVSITLGLIFPIVEFLVKYMYFNLGNLSAPLQSLGKFQNCKLYISIFNYILLTIGYRAIFAVILGILIMFLAQVFKKNSSVYFVTIILIYIPCFTYQQLSLWMQDITLFQGLSGYYVFRSTHNILNFPNYIVGIAVGVVIAFVLILLTRQSFCNKRC